MNIKYICELHVLQSLLHLQAGKSTSCNRSCIAWTARNSCIALSPARLPRAYWFATGVVVQTPAKENINIAI